MAGVHNLTMTRYQEIAAEFYRNRLLFGTLAQPGVVAVYTAANREVPDHHGFVMLPPTMNRPPLARDRQRVAQVLGPGALGQVAGRAAQADGRVGAKRDVQEFFKHNSRILRH